jgi:hypothetical protein
MTALRRNYRFDYFKIVPESISEVAVYGYGSHTGVFSRRYIKSYNTLDAAQADYPFATIDKAAPYLDRDEAPHELDFNENRQNHY